MSTPSQHLAASRMCQAVVLAAGRGQRFDPSGQRFKLEQTLSDGRSVLEHTVSKVAQIFSHFHIITRPTSALAPQFVEQYAAQMKVCPEADLGMGHSLAFAISQLDPECQAVLVVLADMPYLRLSSLQQLRSAMDDMLIGTAQAPILVPTYQGQRGHPVAFHHSLFAQLRTLHGDQGARSLLRAFPVRELALDDCGVVRDIDTAADLRAVD